MSLGKILHRDSEPREREAAKLVSPRSLEDALQRIGKLYGAVSKQSQMLSEGLLSSAGLPDSSVLQGFVEVSSLRYLTSFELD